MDPKERERLQFRRRCILSHLLYCQMLEKKRLKGQTILANEQLNYDLDTEFRLINEELDELRVEIHCRA